MHSFRQTLPWCVCSAISFVPLLTEMASAAPNEVIVVPEYRNAWAANLSYVLAENYDQITLKTILFLADGPNDPQRLEVARKVLDSLPMPGASPKTHYDQLVSELPPYVKSGIGLVSAVGKVDKKGGAVSRIGKVADLVEPIINFSADVYQSVDFRSPKEMALSNELGTLRTNWGASAIALDLAYLKLQGTRGIALIDLSTKKRYTITSRQVDMLPKVRQALEVSDIRSSVVNESAQTQKLLRTFDKKQAAFIKKTSALMNEERKRQDNEGRKFDTQTASNERMIGEFRAFVAVATLFGNRVDPAAAQRIAVLGNGMADAASLTNRFLSRGTLQQIGAMTLINGYVGIALSVAQALSGPSEQAKQAEAMFQMLGDMTKQIARLDAKLEFLIEMVARGFEDLRREVHDVFYISKNTRLQIEEMRHQLVSVKIDFDLSMQGLASIITQASLNYCLQNVMPDTKLDAKEVLRCLSDMTAAVTASDKKPWVNMAPIPSIIGTAEIHRTLQEMLSWSTSSAGIGSLLGYNMNYLKAIAVKFYGLQFTGTAPNFNGLYRPATGLFQVSISNIARLNIQSAFTSEVLRFVEPVKQFVDRTVAGETFQQNLLNSYATTAEELASLRDSVLSIVYASFESKRLPNTAIPPCAPLGVGYQPYELPVPDKSIKHRKVHEIALLAEAFRLGKLATCYRPRLVNVTVERSPNGAMTERGTMEIDIERTFISPQLPDLVIEKIVVSDPSRFITVGNTYKSTDVVWLHHYGAPDLWHGYYLKNVPSSMEATSPNKIDEDATLRELRERIRVVVNARLYSAMSKLDGSHIILGEWKQLNSPPTEGLRFRRAGQDAALSDVVKDVSQKLIEEHTIVKTFAFLSRLYGVGNERCLEQVFAADSTKVMEFVFLNSENQGPPKTKAYVRNILKSESNGRPYCLAQRTSVDTLDQLIERLTTLRTLQDLKQQASHSL